MVHAINRDFSLNRKSVCCVRRRDAIVIHTVAHTEDKTQLRRRRLIGDSQLVINAHLRSVDPSLARGSEYPDSSSTSNLFSDGRRPDTAFQRYRNSRLSGEFHSEITGRSLSECLDECLRQTSFQCRSAVYSEHYHICRLSRFNQRDGHRIIYDADYDYYENLMRERRTFNSLLVLINI